MAERSIFDAAREAVGIQDLVERAVKLSRQGKELRGPCPFCSQGEGSKTVLRVRPERGDFRTFCCEKFGDVVDFHAELHRLSPYDAAKDLAGSTWAQRPAAAPPRKADRPSGPSVSDKVALELWAEAKPIAGTMVEAYLLGRKIAPGIIDLAAPNLRYHPNAKYAWDEGRGGWTRMPAMLLQSVTDAGPTGGIHATYLARKGKGAVKAPVTPAKRMWGQQNGKDGRPGGAWLIGPEGQGDLVTGEGAETVLSVATMAHFRLRPVRACAALSLNRLQGRLLRDDDNCISAFDPQPDPEGPAFTWPIPAADPWERVLVAVDGDMSPVKMRGRTGRGKPVDFELGGDARARLCARLACHWWRQTGAQAAPLFPPPGADFNDELRRVLAQPVTGAGA